MERLIKVSAEGIKKTQPDTIVINFTIEAEDKSYTNMLKLAEEQFIAIQNVIEHVGFDRKQLRTQDYRVDHAYDEYEKEIGVYETVASGYKCYQSLMLKFPIDIQKLHAVLKSIDSCESKPVFHIEFRLSNLQAARNEALHAAAINARHEAELVAEALGVQLGELHKVEIISDGYDQRIIRSHHSTGASSPILLPIGEETGAMQPDNITIFAHAEFIWKIKS